jgi:hypothetical protein
MNNRDLEQLYEATAEDLLFAIGTMVVPGDPPSPYIHVFYRDWTREKLEVVREAFHGSLVLTVGKKTPGRGDLYIATRDVISLEAKEGGHTSVLRAPAWDAQLAEVEDQALRLFEASRTRYGGFLLLLQTSEREFLTVVDDGSGRTIVGAVLARSMPVPPTAP